MQVLPDRLEPPLGWPELRLPAGPDTGADTTEASAVQDASAVADTSNYGRSRLLAVLGVTALAMSVLIALATGSFVISQKKRTRSMIREAELERAHSWSHR